MGAIYLDGGYIAVRKSINNHVFKHFVDINRILEEEIDFKSKLFIWSQKKQLLLEFEIISEENLGASWEYIVQAKINGVSYGRGKGSSKKMAEQAASKETLELMGEV
jgi:ribonuclease-3